MKPMGMGWSTVLAKLSFDVIVGGRGQWGKEMVFNRPSADEGKSDLLSNSSWGGQFNEGSPMKT